jgi:tetratricopeptide (TPR) repeat protein
MKENRMKTQIKSVVTLRKTFKQTVLALCVAAAVAVVNVEAQMRTNISAPPRIAELITSDEGLAYSTPTASLQAVSDLGIRSLMLGDTYRATGNFALAENYIRRGFDLVRGRGSRYWEAVGYEYWALLYRDMGNTTTALDYLRRADVLYRRVLSPLPLNSSIDAVRSLIRELQPDPRFVSSYDSRNYRSQSMEQTLRRTSPAEFLSRDNQTLSETNSRLQQRISSLEDRLRTLEARSGL